MSYISNLSAASLSKANDKALSWRPLQQINQYRLLLSLGLLVIFYKDGWLDFLGSTHSGIFLLSVITLFCSSILFLVLSIRGNPKLETQVILSNTSDILLITLLTHSSGGLSSSLSILLIINVTATGIFLKGKHPFVFASLASIAVLGEQTFSFLNNTSHPAEYTHAGLLGLVFFTTSFLASTLSNQVRRSEKLAIEREEDIISLEILNDDIIQSMRTGIIVVDHNGYIRLSNGSAESLLGNIPLQSKPLLKNILPALDARLVEWREQPNMHHKSIRQEHGLPDIQPGFRELHRTGKGTGDTLIFLEDATQLNQRFQQIKLASLGRLTASIAHEIRNPLSAINHASQLLQESELDKADKKLTDIITTQVQRLDKVIQNVLQLSKDNKSSNEAINLKDWLLNFCHEFKQNNNLTDEQLTLSPLQEDMVVLFDSSHLNQIMNNLCSNSINHNNRELKNIYIHISYGYDEQFGQPYIQVKDNGPGIPKEVIEQIFDPFFTTSSKGTGLGLYISKEMVESNRGRIRYISEETGSCFKIHFLQHSNETSLPISGSIPIV